MPAKKRILSMRKLFVLALVALTSHVSASSLFEETAVLDIQVTGPISTLIEEKENREEFPFVLRTDEVEHPIKVRVRGNSRLRVCDFPPLRLNFSRNVSEQSVFAGQDKLKLVTHCEKGDSANENVLEEYAAYKIFNIIADVAYKVRLAQVTYHDTDEDAEPVVRYGILIESASALAERVGGDIVEVPSVTLSSLEENQAAAVFIFQYLIGNTDWSLVAADTDDTCCHNGDLFDIGQARYYVPYDFDLSGLVNARYAKPDPTLRISRVTQRQYRGYCISPDAIVAALQDIHARRTDILNVIEQLPGLSQKSIDLKKDYLEQFFARAIDEEKTVRLIERNCL